MAMMFPNLDRSMGPSDTLKIECGACGRRSTWTRKQAFALLGPGSTPADIRWRLACAGCKVKGRARVWI